MKTLYKFIIVLLLSVLTACGDGEPANTPSKNLVVYYGDSLVNHSGDRLRLFLGIPVHNYGKDAQMSYHAINGLYGSIDWSSDALYVFSWGTNEQLQNISVDQFKSDMNFVITTAKSKGKLIVLEAPLRGQFLDVLKDLSIAHSVPLSVYVPKESEFISDNVHLNGEGLDNRAKILAAVVLKELTK